SLKKQFVHFRQLRFKCFEHFGGAPDKDACVPQVVSAVDEALSSFFIGLFCELCHFLKAFSKILLIKSDVSVSCVRSGRLDAKGDKAWIRLRGLQCISNIFAKLNRVEYQMVGRSYHYRSAGIQL